MLIARERFLDDSSQLAVSLMLQTRTTEMHSLLSDAPEDVRAAIGVTLAQALDRIQDILRERVAARQAAPGATSFGCGT